VELFVVDSDTINIDTIITNLGLPTRLMPLRLPPLHNPDLLPDLFGSSPKGQAPGARRSNGVTGERGWLTPWTPRHSAALQCLG
jgi:hypothetical protein